RQRGGLVRVTGNRINGGMKQDHREIMRTRFGVLAVLGLAIAACSPSGNAVGTAISGPVAIDSVRLMQDISVLAHDSMAGRMVGTAGSARARTFLERSFRERGLAAAAGNTYLMPFTFERNDTSMTGVNVVGQVRGTSEPESYIVVTAHYDHVGV